MKKTDLPTRRPVPFGANGPRRNLTDDTPTGSNQASYDKGFPPVTMTIRAAGGLPPDGRDMNQAFNELYTGLRWQNAGTGYPFDADFAAAIGGYPAGAKVPNSTNDGFWLNTTDDNANNPEVEDASVTGWVPAGNYGITTLTGLATGTVTLTTLQAAKEEIILSGNLTANITVIFPAWIKNWTVVNNCMGDFTLTCKTQSGTGVVVNSGRNAISCDGENMVFDIPAASLTKAGITQLSSATDSNSETMAATPKAVKAAYDLASNPNLAAIAGLNTSTDKVAYFTGPGTAALTTLTQLAREIIEKTTVPEVLNHLGAAPVISPQLTGVPTAPTAPDGNASTQIATTEYAINAISNAINAGGIATQSWVTSNFLQGSIRLASVGTVSNNNYQEVWAYVPDGAVATGGQRRGDYFALQYRYVQYNIGGTWYTAGVA